MFTLCSAVLKDDSGQDLAEYGMLISLIAVVVVLAIAAFGTNMSAWFNDLSTQIRGVLG